MVVLLALCRQAPAVAQDDPPTEFYDLLNQARMRSGAAPLGKSTLLQQAAQHHADDIAQRGVTSHEGADGSDYRQRIRDVGYRAWNDGLMVNETIWMGLGSAADALNWFINSSEWVLLVEPQYREIGVGYAEDSQGIHYFVIVLGSRPGVIPIFINDAQQVTDSPQVAVRLTNEDAVPLGEGTWMGKAIEVRLSNSPDFGDTLWQPWEKLLPWMLAGTEPGDYAVYVEFRDGAGRTAIAEAVIRLVSADETLPTPTPLPNIVPIPVGVTPQVNLTPTGEQSSPTPFPTPVIQHTATLPESAQPTWTPLPIEDIEPSDEAPPDWPLLAALGLQGLALFLGFAVFLRRR
ncbi:MAG: hypothetical protein JXA21_03350 [Anaerolineae bacterium]|nr:hypothetical protein [Anaerolineae bacterium]